MEKIYQVIFQDEWNNLILIGFYNKLEDAIPDVNAQLELYNVSITKDDLKEYASTFGFCFDLDVANLCYDNENIDEDEIPNVYIRGFIFDKEILLKEIK